MKHASRIIAVFGLACAAGIAWQMANLKVADLQHLLTACVISVFITGVGILMMALRRP